MSQSPERDRDQEHPTIREHPEQRRQEESGREDPTEPAALVGAPHAWQGTPRFAQGRRSLSGRERAHPLRGKSGAQPVVRRSARQAGPASTRYCLIAAF